MKFLMFVKKKEKNFKARISKYNDKTQNITTEEFPFPVRYIKAICLSLATYLSRLSLLHDP